MEVAGPLGTPLGLAQRKRASPRGKEGKLDLLSSSVLTGSPAGGAAEGTSAGGGPARIEAVSLYSFLIIFDLFLQLFFQT